MFSYLSNGLTTTSNIDITLFSHIKKTALSINHSKQTLHKKSSTFFTKAPYIFNKNIEHFRAELLMFLGIYFK